MLSTGSTVKQVLLHALNWQQFDLATELTSTIVNDIDIDTDSDNINQHDQAFDIAQSTNGNITDNDTDASNEPPNDYVK